MEKERKFFLSVCSISSYTLIFISVIAAIVILVSKIPYGVFFALGTAAFGILTGLLLLYASRMFCSISEDVEISHSRIHSTYCDVREIKEKLDKIEKRLPKGEEPAVPEKEEPVKKKEWKGIDSWAKEETKTE